MNLKGLILPPERVVSSGSNLWKTDGAALRFSSGRVSYQWADYYEWGMRNI